MRAYIQQVNPGDSNYLGMMQSAYWFEQRGYEIVRFSIDDIDNGRLDDDLFNHPEEMVVRGGVGTIRKVLLRAGRPLPPPLDLPASLAPWIGRNYWQTTLGQVRASLDSDNFIPLHIKPLDHLKLFTGHIVREFRDLIATAGIPAETPVLAQEVVPFISEWRATILRDRILNIGHYRGDPLVFPDPERVRSAISAFENRPIGFAMDWGINSDNRTLLVEVNDGFALGNYGVPGTAYTALIEARWQQLMGLPDNTIGNPSYD